MLLKLRLTCNTNLHNICREMEEIVTVLVSYIHLQVGTSR